MPECDLNKVTSECHVLEELRVSFKVVKYLPSPEHRSVKAIFSLYFDENHIG